MHAWKHHTNAIGFKIHHQTHKEKLNNNYYLNMPHMPLRGWGKVDFSWQIRKCWNVGWNWFIWTDFFILDKSVQILVAKYNISANFPAGKSFVAKYSASNLLLQNTVLQIFFCTIHFALLQNTISSFPLRQPLMVTG